MAADSASKPIVVYLSSTLSDLIDERRAIKDVLSGTCVVKESYDPSTANLVKKCYDDIEKSEVFIGVIGLRYGFVPTGYTKSITQLEFEKAKERGLPRFLFLKNEDAITANLTDAMTGEHPKERIGDFRKQLTSGAEDETTPGRFGNLPDLKLAVQRVISAFINEKKGTKQLFGGDEPHPWTVKYQVAIGYVRGTDQVIKDAIEDGAGKDQRVTFFGLSPDRPSNYFAALDEHARKSRSIALLVTSASLTRLLPAAKDIAASIEMIRERSAGVFGLLVDVKPDAVPADVLELLNGVFETTTDLWSPAKRAATFETFQQWRRARAPESSTATRIAMPYMVVALNETEANAMHDDPDTFFAGFGATAASIRRTEFEGLRTRLLQVAPKWPAGFYGPERKDWRPFGSGPDMLTMDAFVLAATRRVNESAPGTREQRILRNARISLRRYSFDEYVEDRAGSRENVRRVCDLGCLILLDELALLHPTLRKDIEKLLVSNNAAVVSICACDPMLRPLGELLDDLSFLKVGNLLSRFSGLEDLRCELALNSVERLQRWLRLVLPELLTTLGEKQVNPDLAGNVDELFDRPTAGMTP